MAAPPDIRQRAIALIEQLPAETLGAILQLLELLAEPPAKTTPQPEEVALLNIIQRQLPPHEVTRLMDLRDRCEWDELTETEQQELIAYEDRLEQQNVERLEALMQLSSLRNIDRITLNRQFKPESHSLHAT